MNTEVADFHGEEGNYVFGEGEMYLARVKDRNVFEGFLRFRYRDKTGKEMFEAIYKAEMKLRLSKPWSKEGKVDGRTIMVCRDPIEENGHDSFARWHIQKLDFNRKELSLEGTSKIEGQVVYGQLKARKASP